MDEERILSHQSEIDATRKSSNSEGAAAATEDLMDPSGCFSGSIFLTKREC